MIMNFWILPVRESYPCRDKLTTESEGDLKMNQNKTTSGTKPGGRDFINLGIFTVIFIVLFMACNVPHCLKL